MRRFTGILVFLLILAACTPPAGPASTEITESKPQAVALAGTLETSLLATIWDDSPEDNALFPLDPATGTALPGYEPIAIGYSSYTAFSPDRQTLAVVSFPTANTYDGSLLLIDLSAWKTRRFDLDLMGWVGVLAFSPDGKRLAIAHGDMNYQLTMVDVERGSILAQSQTDSFVSRLKFTQDGQALMLYSPAADDPSTLSSNPPQVLLLAATDLSPRWSMEVEGVRDGVFPKDETVTTRVELFEQGNALYLSPGLAFAPDEDMLYIVHADAEQLTTVDFSAQHIRTLEIQPKLSWFEQLLSLTAGVAHAKFVDGTNKQAVISPDGQWLYVIGMSHSSSKDQNGSLQLESTPLGLEIIQTGDGSRAEHLETDATELSLSPDGRFLYLRDWSGTTPWTEIFDAANRQLIAHKANLFASPALLVNGEALLASTYSTSEASHHMSVLEADGSRVLAEWTDSKSIWWLTAP